MQEMAGLTKMELWLRRTETS